MSGAAAKAGSGEIASSTDARSRFGAVMDAAARSGLPAEKSTRISPALLDRAKRRTGIEADTDLIAFALASVALDDGFPAVFEAVGGTVDPDLKLGFSRWRTSPSRRRPGGCDRTA